MNISTDKMELESSNVKNSIEESSILKNILVRSETSVLKEASEQIKRAIESNEIEDGEIIDDDQIQKTKLAEQVQQGEITPFQAAKKHSEGQKTKGTFNKTTQLLDFEKYLLQQAEFTKQKKTLKKSSKSRQEKIEHPLPKKQKRLEEKEHTEDPVSTLEDSLSTTTTTTTLITSKTISQNHITKSKRKNKEIVVNLDVDKDNSVDKSNLEVSESGDSGSEYVPSDEPEDSDDESRKRTSTGSKRSSKTKQLKEDDFPNNHTKRILDDGDEDIYRQRVEDSGCMRKPKSVHKIDNLFKVPQCIWKKLYRYQKVSVQWLWELHGRDLGGLLGDEMGLGKTIQVIAFLAGLDCSDLLSDGGRFRGLGPTLIVCPATLMEQWVKHLHDWWPILRAAVLHQSGTYNGDAEYLVKYSLKNTGGVLITSYSGVLRHKDLLVNTKWHYVILDEGHKIRNPEAKVSKAVKEFSTPHRLLLTGSPMQNSLKELWSLFDFILPGKLGTLPAFLEHCATPIVRGGYANATSLQEATALQIATMLKDAITPYMLRRTKADVKHHVNLPDKNEQVLFCSFTDEQKKLYQNYLRSDDVSLVLHDRDSGMNGRYRARLLIALSALRKICNHPDLFLYTAALVCNIS